MKNLLIWLVALSGIGVVADLADTPKQPSATIESSTTRSFEVTTQATKAKPVVTDEDIEESIKRSTSVNDTGLSNDNYYTNVDGNKVHSPAYSADGDVPAGASARCRDGTYSFSQNRRGTCSHHGGVASWL